MPSALAELVRRHDPDRFLATLFAPAAHREALLALYALNHELARAREVASEPMLALIRLQWWREVVEGSRRQHEVAAPLAAALEAGLLDRAPLLAMIDAREAEAQPGMPDRDAWLAYLHGTAGTLAVAAGRLLCRAASAATLTPTDEERLSRLGAAYGAAGVLRSVPVLARQGRCLLPADVLDRHGLSADAVVADPHAPALAAAVRELAEAGRALLHHAGDRPLPRAAMPAALVAVLARRDLRDPDWLRSEAALRPRGLGDRLAMTLAGLRGRI